MQFIPLLLSRIIRHSGRHLDAEKGVNMKHDFLTTVNSVIFSSTYTYSCNIQVCVTVCRLVFSRLQAVRLKMYNILHSNNSWKKICCAMSSSLL